MADHGSRYREIRRLGAGGMAKVVLAEDTVLGRLVALKRVYASGDPHQRQRLKREALVGASLSHPNLVFVYDVHAEGDGDLMIVMEYVDGEALSELIASRGSLPPGEALRILHQIAAGLDAIHAKGIVHRDVKPANILLGSDGGAKLADLGVAGVADPTHTTSHEAIVGSFSYMALEQLEGERPSPAMDVYALAAVAYELLSGRKARPETNPLALARAISTQPPPDLRSAWPGAPAAAAAVLNRGMSRDPRERPASAGELIGRLQRAVESQPATEAVPAIAFAKPGATPAIAFAKPDSGTLRAGRRRAAKLLPAIATLAVLLAVAVTVAALSSGGGKRSGTRSTLAARPGHSTSTASPSSPSAPGGAGHASAGANSGSAANASGNQQGTPSGAVEAFYEAAAAHRYPTAWALADASMRSELGGFVAFQNEMSSVRSIAFHRAQVLSGQSPASATVALQTTSVQADRTQQCAGTADTVRADSGWLLDGISISCS